MERGEEDREGLGRLGRYLDHNYPDTIANHWGHPAVVDADDVVVVVVGR